MRKLLAAAGLILAALLITVYFTGIFVLSGFTTWEDVALRLSWGTWAPDTFCLVFAGVFVCAIIICILGLRAALPHEKDPKAPTVEDFGKVEDPWTNVR